MKEVSVNEAHEALKENSQAIYLDVRTEMEFTAGHPEGAYNIPVFHRGPAGMEPNADFERTVKANVSMETPIYCGCQAGGRSLKAAEMLSTWGYQIVANIQGGFGGSAVHPGWQMEGLPIAFDIIEGRSYQELLSKANG